MTNRIIELAREAGGTVMEPYDYGAKPDRMIMEYECIKRLAALVRAEWLEEVIKIIEEHRIPVGNSAAGEIACELTYAALHEIRDEIRALKDKP